MNTARKKQETWDTFSHLTDAEIKALRKVAIIAADPSPYLALHQKRCSVTVAGIVIGHVFGSTETIERRTKGKRYVNARWTRPCWRVAPRPSHRVVSWYNDAYAFRSRIRAVAALVEFVLEDGGALAPKRVDVLRALRKIVADKD